MKRNGTLFIVIGAALTLVGTLIHVFPPHQTVVTVILGLAGALSYTVGIGRIVGGVRRARSAAPYVVIAACVTWGGLMGVAPVAVDTIALAALGEKHVCTVTDVDKETRRTRSGRSTTYVHTVRCPDARVHEVSAGVGERHSRPAASRSVTGDAAA
ncbi:hypothetical protein [Nonomuraea sp. KM88]|uniref:hypothetical protein n=1 Tax=Nonomuraea sp. KM88 TaxID=3457427 RepID=UPI003FCCA328